MAIVFDCPHCKEPYKLKDEFAGRKATCKNPDCRQQITIPTPPSAAELEAAALSALAEETAKQKEQAAAPPENVIPMSCPHCEHKWAEPMSKAGKNVLCPNPECRQRIRVPEPKGNQPLDWRQQNTKLPSLAKQAHEKLEGVEDAGQARIVSGEALREAGATGIEYEPRPLKQKVMFVVLPLLLVGALGYGGYYLWNRGKTKGEEEVMTEAKKQFGDTSSELAQGELGLCDALFKAAESEFILRRNTEKALVEAHDALSKGHNVLQRAPQTAGRNAVAGELASLAISLGGTNDEIKAQIRFPWVPETASRSLGMGQNTRTVHEIIQRLMQSLVVADFDFKISLARRLTRELIKKGQAKLAADILPLALFNEPERDEARAVIALEIKRGDPSSDVPQQVANDLKTKIDAERNAKPPSIKGAPFPVSTQTLCAAVGVDIRPLVSPLGATGGISDAQRVANVGRVLMENPSSVEEAVKIATRGTSSDAPSQLKALVLCAEWASNPGPAIDAALTLVNARGKQTLSQSNILRLAQIAAYAGKHQQARELAEALSDEGLKAWAHGDAARQRILANPKEKADEAWLEIPATPDKLRAGHLWGRYWIARQNAKLSGSRSDEKKVIAGWSPAPLRPFGLAGIALGLQER